MSEPAPSTRTPDLYAVVIGIDFYPNQLNNKSTSLSGCVGDARSFEKHIQGYLQRRETPPEKWGDYLTVLTSTPQNPTTFRPYVAAEKELKKPLPDAETIIKAIQNVGEKAQKGDTVFISYAGHGNREETVIGDWSGKSSELDETLCPWDKCMGGLTVRDFTLNYLFKAIAAKGVNLTVFLDCCNSGGTTRAPVDEKIDENSPPPILIRKMPATKGAGAEIKPDAYWNERGPLRDKKAEIKAAWDDLMDRTSQKSAATGVLLRPMDYSLFTGCLQHEYSGENYGAGYTTTGALDALATLKFAPKPEEVTLAHIYRHISDKVYSRMREPGTNRPFLQTPLLLGDQSRAFPGSVVGDLPPPKQQSTPATFHIRAQPDSSKSPTMFPLLYLRAGAIHGAQVGSEYAVYRWFDTPGTSPAEVRVVITEVRNTVSVLALSSGPALPPTWADLGKTQQQLQNARRTQLINPRTKRPYWSPLPEYYPWPTGCVATLLSGPASAAKKIKLAGPVPALKEPVYIPGETPLTFLPSDSTDQEDFRIAPTTTTTPAGKYDIQDTQGTVLLSGLSSVSATATALAQIAKYQRLLAISGTSFLECFELTRREDDAASPGRVQVSFSWLQEEAATPNKPYVNFTVLHFGGAPGYAVKKVYPPDGEFESMDPADWRDFSVEKGTGGVLKAMVFWASTGFGGWEMEPLVIGEGDGGGFPVGEPVSEAKAVVGPSPLAGEEAYRDVEEHDTYGEAWFDLWCTKDLKLE